MVGHLAWCNGRVSLHLCVVNVTHYLMRREVRLDAVAAAVMSEATHGKAIMFNIQLGTICCQQLVGLVVGNGRKLPASQSVLLGVVFVDGVS